MQRIVTELPYFLGFLETPWEYSSLLEHSDFLNDKGLVWSEFYELADQDIISYEKDVSVLFCGFVEESLKNRDFPIVIRHIRTYTDSISVEVFLDYDLFVRTSQKLGKTKEFKENFVNFQYNNYVDSEVFQQVIRYFLDTTEKDFQDDFCEFLYRSINFKDYINIPNPIVEEIKDIKERHNKEFYAYLKTNPKLTDDQKTKLQIQHEDKLSAIVKHFIQSYKYGEFIWNDNLKGYLMKW